MKRVRNTKTRGEHLTMYYMERNVDGQELAVGVGFLPSDFVDNRGLVKHRLLEARAMLREVVARHVRLHCH